MRPIHLIRISLSFIEFIFLALTHTHTIIIHPFFDCSSPSNNKALQSSFRIYSAIFFSSLFLSVSCLFKHQTKDNIKSSRWKRKFRPSYWKTLTHHPQSNCRKVVTKFFSGTSDELCPSGERERETWKCHVIEIEQCRWWNLIKIEMKFIVFYVSRRRCLRWCCCYGAEDNKNNKTDFSGRVSI